MQELLLWVERFDDLLHNVHVGVSENRGVKICLGPGLCRFVKVFCVHRKGKHP
ncbi:hypothetical protein CCP2SC5_10016 [Azospirillaceae bacterium]